MYREQSSYSFRKLYYFILLSRLSFVSSFEYVCANGFLGEGMWKKESKILNRTITKLNTHPTNINKTKAFSFPSLISAGKFSLLSRSFSYVCWQLQKKVQRISHRFSRNQLKRFFTVLASEIFSQTWSSAYREMLRNRWACSSKEIVVVNVDFLHKRRKVQRVLMITVILVYM